MHGKPVRMTRSVVSLYVGRETRLSVVPELFRFAQKDDANFYSTPLKLRAYRDAVTTLDGKDSRNGASPALHASYSAPYMVPPRMRG